MKIVVTGISGFIGSHVAAALADSGHEVTGSYRSNSPRIIDRYGGTIRRSNPAAGRRITPVKADLSEQSSLRQLVDGTDGIVHIAGFASDWGTTEQFHRANVLPVQYILDAIESGKISPKFFIHTSSLSVHGFGPQRNGTEDGKYFKLISHYQRSKMESEELIRSAAGRYARPGMAIIRPGNVYGPGDSTTMYPMLNAIADGRMGYVSGGKRLTCPVFIDDLVTAYIQLVEKLIEEKPEVHGSVYNITGGEDITWRQVIELCADNAGLKRPNLSVPGWLGMVAAGILVSAYHLIGAKSPPDLTPYRIQQVSNDYHFSMERAKNDLEWIPRTEFKRGIIETIEAWKQHAKG